MIATNPIPDVCNYAQCGEKCAPTPEQAAAGLVPLSTIPAQRWNSLWNAANQSVNCLKSAAGALIDEINSVLTATGITPDPTCTDQLYQAIDCIRNALGTDQVAGSVKSSSVAGQVSIDTNGIMIANCVGNATQLTTSCKELTSAVNELKTTYDNAFTQVWGNAAWITDCRADNYHASSALTYGGGTSALYGHVKLSDVYDSCVGNAASSIAASQLTLYCLTQAVENMSGLSNYTARDFDPFTKVGTAGTSPQAARSDHVHQLDCNYWPYTTAMKATYQAQCPFNGGDVELHWVANYVNDWHYTMMGFFMCQQEVGWYQYDMYPTSYLKGYFHGCNVGDFLRPWLFDNCYPGRWRGPRYTCWDCVRSCTGLTWDRTGGYASTGTNMESWCTYSVAGVQGLCYGTNVTISPTNFGCSAPYTYYNVNRATCGGSDLVFTTAAFQVIYPRCPYQYSDCNIYMRCYSHALICPTNAPGTPTQAGQNQSAYLTYLTTSIWSWFCLQHQMTSQYFNVPMQHPGIQRALSYTLPYAISESSRCCDAFIMYAMEAALCAINTESEVLYVR